MKYLKVELSGCYLEFKIGGGFLASRWGIGVHRFSVCVAGLLSCSPSSHRCLIPPWGSPSLSFEACLHFVLVHLTSPILFSPPASFPSHSWSSHLPTSPALVHCPALPYKRHFLDCSVISCPVYAVVFLFLSYPLLWRLITISWVYFKKSHPIKENQDRWIPFPFQFSNEETCGFFGQVVRGASRQKSQR